MSFTLRDVPDAILRELSEGDDTVALYARLALAARKGRSVHLSVDDIEMLLHDSAVEMAILTAVVDLGDEP